MPFTLKPAEKADIPTLIQMGDEACKDNRHTQFKALPQHADYDHGKTMTSVLEIWLDRPWERCRTIKAVDDTTGEIIECVTWGFRSYGRDPSPVELKLDTSGFYDLVVTSKRGIARLEETTNTAMRRWMGKMMVPGQKCMYIIGISVRPANQGQDVGSALIRYGTGLADRDGVVSWVSSSEVGARAFKKHGFGEGYRLDVDLDEFACEEAEKRKSETDDQGRTARQDTGTETRYGIYTFRYMARSPLTR